MERDSFLVYSHGGMLSRYFDVKDGYTFVLFTEPYKCNYVGGSSSMIRLVNSSKFLNRSCYDKIPAKLISDIHKTTGTFNNMNHICKRTIRKECGFCKELNKFFSSTNINLRNEGDFNELKYSINDTFLRGRNSAMLYYLWGVESTKLNYSTILSDTYNLFIDDIKELVKLDDTFFDTISESEIVTYFKKLKKIDFSIMPEREPPGSPKAGGASGVSPARFIKIGVILYFENITYMLFKYYSSLLCDNLDLEDYKLDFMMQYLQLECPYSDNEHIHYEKLNLLFKSVKYNFKSESGFTDCWMKTISDIHIDDLKYDKIYEMTFFEPRERLSDEETTEEFTKTCREYKINQDIAFYRKTDLIPGWKVIKNRKSELGFYFKLEKDVFYKDTYKSKIIKTYLKLDETENKISENYIFAKARIAIPYNMSENISALEKLDEFYEKQENDIYTTVYGSKSQYDVNYRRMQDMVLIFEPMHGEAIFKSGIYKLPNEDLADFTKFTKSIHGEAIDFVRREILPIKLKSGELWDFNELLSFAKQGSLDLTIPEKSLLGHIWKQGNIRKFNKEAPINKSTSMKLSDIQKHYPPGIYFITGCRIEMKDADTKLYDTLQYYTLTDKPTPQIARQTSSLHQTLRKK
jgi:hypothetical protein